jgi:uncharacterized membrane protein (GlpM family)
MTKRIYDKSIETRELQMVGFWVNFTHFSVVGFLLIMPTTVLVFHLMNFIQNHSDSFREGEIWIVTIPPVLATIFYFMQKRQLKFKVINTTLNSVQLKEVIIEVAKKLNWEFKSATTNTYVAKTNPGFFSGSWGEQITILFDNDRVFVNSICDPEKRSSIFSAGRNNENEQTLIDKIKEAESQSGTALEL